MWGSTRSIESRTQHQSQQGRKIHEVEGRERSPRRRSLLKRPRTIKLRTRINNPIKKEAVGDKRQFQGIKEKETGWKHIMEGYRRATEKREVRSTIENGKGSLEKRVSRRGDFMRVATYTSSRAASRDTTKILRGKGYGNVKTRTQSLGRKEERKVCKLNCVTCAPGHSTLELKNS